MNMETDLDQDPVKLWNLLLAVFLVLDNFQKYSVYLKLYLLLDKREGSYN
jgi:hypothetical protein